MMSSFQSSGSRFRLAKFLLIPIFSLSDGGIGNSQNAMSSAMTVNGVPNDVITNFNSLTIVFFAPLFNFVIYPWCRKIGYPLKPKTRMGILLGERQHDNRGGPAVEGLRDFSLRLPAYIGMYDRRRRLPHLTLVANPPLFAPGHRRNSCQCNFVRDCLHESSRSYEGTSLFDGFVTQCIASTIS